MEFFDKLSKKVGEVYQGAKTKTEEVSQEFKLKNEIAKRKAAIEKIYAEIGVIVYEDIKDNKDVSRDVIEAKCSEITANKEEISRLEAEVLKVKNIRICENCKNEIDFKGNGLYSKYGRSTKLDLTKDSKLQDLFDTLVASGMVSPKPANSS